MSIDQLNLYIPGQNLSNMGSNIDYNRFQSAKIQISVNFGTTPATVSVLIGSLIEVNGNLYTISSSNETFQMSNASDNYITFTDSPSTSFDSASTIGTYSAPKQGYYQTGNIERTLPFYIDQSGESVFNLIDEKSPDLTPWTNTFDHAHVEMNGNQNIAATVAAVVEFDTVYFDLLSNYDNVNYRFVASESGYYKATAIIRAVHASGGAVATLMDIRKNGAAVRSVLSVNVGTGSDMLTLTLTEYLQATQYLDVYVTEVGGAAGNMFIDKDYSNFIVDRML
jgi:hypothetical protein